jgi:hypothetical protein
MSISMALYVAESNFASLSKVTEQTKAMLNSWTVNVNEETSKVLDFDPTVPNVQSRPTNPSQRIYDNQPSRQDYERYGWLFGGR